MIRLAILAWMTVTVLIAERQHLFNGKDLDGWSPLSRLPGEPLGGFTVDDGLLKTKGPQGVLWYTRAKIGDARLRVVFTTDASDGNSGMFIRIPDVPQSSLDAIHKGFEVSIAENGDDWHRTGTLYSFTKARARSPLRLGEWNVLEITLQGKRTVVHLNGVLVTDYDGLSEVPLRKTPKEPERGPRPEEGYVAIQNHTGVFSFKEISIELSRPK